jgi:capsular exopolysaccharide synthesis family protein
MNDITKLSRPQIASPDEGRAGLQRNNGASSLPASASYLYDAEEKQGSHLVEYWRTIRKHIWLIIGISLLIPTLTAVYLVRKPDVYESQARIQVDLENANPLLNGMSKNSSIILSNESNDPAYFNTQLQILAGPGLLRRVVKNLDLEHNPSFMHDTSGNRISTWTRMRKLLGFKVAEPTKFSKGDVLPVTSSGTSSKAVDLAESERLADYVEDLQLGVRVEPVKETRLTVRETRLIDVSYRHTDPHLAAKIVNDIAETFVLQNLEKRTETSSSTGSYLQQRIAELQSNIRNKEEELINYGKTHQILSLNEKENTVVERLAGLNKQLLDAENERKLAEAAYNASLQPGAARALAEGGVGERDVPSATKVTTEVELRLAELRQRRAELSVENTDKWPAVQEIDRQITTLEKQKNETRSRATEIVTTNYLTRYRQAKAAEDALRKSYEQQRAETLTQNEAAVSYRIIQQEIDTYKTLLDGLLQRTRENDVVAAGTPNNIRIVDYAIAGKNPVAPKRTLVVGLSFMLALGLGIALSFFLEYLDDSVRTPEDVENFLRLPAIAVIPQTGNSKPRRLIPQKGGAVAPSTALAPNEVLLSDLDKRSPIAEAYRHLRTSILLSTAGRPPKTLLITSSVPSEGKTTTAVNTAMSLAQTGAKVLIIDADMRRPRLHSIFNLSNANGLSSLLAREFEEREVAEAFQKVDEPGLFVLTAGPVPPNPAELIGSEQMLRLLATVTPNFTHVIIDSPPVAAFTDGVLIAAMVEGVLLVVHSGKNSRKVVGRGRKLLHDVGARIIGVVLNKVPNAGGTSYYYYGGYYSHYSSTEDTAEQRAAS